MPIYELDGVRPNLAGQSVVNEDCWVAPCATLVGKITLQLDANIWFGAVLRGDNEEIVIGKGSNVQDLTMMHTDIGFPLTVGSNCTIGHKAIIHGCTIGDDTLIGMGATVMNGAVVGKNCLIGAGALVTEGKDIPDGALVMGSPAKVVRMLGDEGRAGLRRPAEAYVQNWRRFARELRVID